MKSELAARAVKERPILFSAPMVRATLDGRKVQTRRIVRNDAKVCAACFTEAVPHNDGDGGMGIFGSDPYLRVAACDHNDRMGERIRCPHGVPGDRLWVRETWCKIGETATGVKTIAYRADDDIELAGGLRWIPSIHMPRWASRIDLEITAVRVERLQEITEEDARAEGVTTGELMPATINGERGQMMIFDPRKAFAMLWDSINAKRAPWASNPWAWVIEFRRVRP